MITCLYVCQSVWLPVCMFASLYDYLFVCLTVCMITCLYVWQSVWLPVCMFDSLYDYLFVCLPVCMITCLYVWQSVWLPVCMFDSLYDYLFVCLTVCMITCLYVWQSVWLPVCMFDSLCVRQHKFNVCPYVSPPASFTNLAPCMHFIDQPCFQLIEFVISVSQCSLGGILPCR